MCGGFLCEPPASVRQHGGKKHASAYRRQFPYRWLFSSERDQGELLPSRQASPNTGSGWTEGAVLIWVFFIGWVQPLQDREN